MIEIKAIKIDSEQIFRYKGTLSWEALNCLYEETSGVLTSCFLPSQGFRQHLEVPDARTPKGRPGACHPGEIYKILYRLSKMQFPVFPGLELVDREGLLRR